MRPPIAQILRIGIGIGIGTFVGLVVGACERRGGARPPEPATTLVAEPEALPEAAATPTEACDEETYERVRLRSETIEVDELLALAKACAEPRDSIATLALYKASTRRSIKQSLLEFARGYKNDMMLARLAIVRLGDEFVDGHAPALEQELTEIKRAAKHNLIQGAVDATLRLAFLGRQFEELHTLNAQLDFVVPIVALPLPVVSHAEMTMDNRGINPLVAWADRRLFELSQRAPKLAADRICATEVVEQGESKAFYNWTAQRFGAQLLAPKARARVLATCAADSARPSP